MTQPTFQPPDTSLALRAGLISGVLGLVIVVLVTLAVGRSQINAETVQTLVERAQLLPMCLSLFVMSIAFFFLGLRWQALFPPPHKPSGFGLSAILCAGLLLKARFPVQSVSLAQPGSPTNGTAHHSV